MAGSSMLRMIQRIQEKADISRQGQEYSAMKKGQRLKPNLYKCSKCRDTGWILKEQEHAQPLAVLCECRRKNKVREQWKSCGINPEMINYKFSNFKIWNKESKLMKDTAMAYLGDFKNIRKCRQNSMMLCGQVGSGKTHLSIAAAISLIKSQVRVVYMPYRDIMTNIKQNMLDEEYYKKSLSRYQNCEVLLIDDLFKGRVNDSDINIMFEIINYRYLNYLPMIVSSEFTIDELLKFDQGVGSRVYEMCKCYSAEISRNIDCNYRLR